MESYLEDLHTAALFVWRVGSPTVLALGTFGNLMAIVICFRLRREGKAPGSVHFLALACSDLVLLLSGLLPRWMIIEFDFSLVDASDVSCKLVRWTVYTSGAMSPWLLVAVTAERAAAVTWPHRVKTMCTSRCSQINVCCMIVLLLAANAHFLYGWSLVPSGQSVNGTHARLLCGMSSRSYYFFFTAVWSWVDLIIFNLAPFVILLVSNALLIKSVVMSLRHARQSLAAGSAAQQLDDREKKASSLTVTLIGLSLTFFLLTGPICTYLLSKPYLFRNFQTDLRELVVAELVFSVVNFLWYSNSAAIFYVYCLTGNKYRSEFLSILRSLGHSVMPKCKARSLNPQDVKRPA